MEAPPRSPSMTTEDHDLIVRTAAVVEEIHHRLFGNGNPGEIKTIQKDVQELQDYKSWIRGAFAVVALLITVFGGMLIEHLSRTH
jgi:hypothetical protein